MRNEHVRGHIKLAVREITKEEWEAYKWEGVRDYIYDSMIWIRGVKRTQPPDDGYEYEEVTHPVDTEQKWARRVTVDENVKL